MLSVLLFHSFLCSLILFFEFKEIEEARLAKKAKKEGKNIGQKIEKNTKDEETLQSIIKANKKNFDLERASRFKKCNFSNEHYLNKIF